MWKEKFKNKMITLKPFNAEDLDQAIELFMDEKVKKTYMLPDFETREKAIALFERLKNLSYNEERFVRGIYLNGEFIGMVNDVGIEGDKLEIGYAIRSQYHNQGYGTEMLKIALNYLIEQGGKKKSEIKSAMRSASRTDKLWEEYIEASTVTNDSARTKELVEQLTRIYGTWSQATVALRQYRKRIAEQDK